MSKIKATLRFNRLPDGDLLKHLNTVYERMNSNSAFPKPPVDMATFRTAIDTFSASVTEAEDGGKKAISAKNKQREVVINLDTQLAHYVEASSNGDVAVFNTSGFEIVSNLRSAPVPLPPAAIDWIDRGSVSGQVEIKVKPLSKVVSYDVRYAALGADKTPGTWTTVTLASSKKATIDNLTPGTTYAFQVRAFGKLGHTDWSDSITFICA